MLRLTHAAGELSLTPDHVLWADGAYVAARDVRAGAALSGGALVLAVTDVPAAPVVNPVTADARILAAAPGSATPVVAATHPEWIAHFMLAAPAFPLPLTAAISFAAPARTQAAYDAWLEPIR
eukprot:977478-Prymnesium_polylepis.1